MRAVEATAKATILVQRGGDVLRLMPGGEMTFGRGEANGTHLRLDDPAVSRLAGKIRAVEDYWHLSNLSASTTYVVENPEGGGEFVKVPPGRLGAPVAYEFARVVIPARGGPVTFMVYAPEHTVLEAGQVDVGARTVVAYSLDPTARYFLVLVAMCEPRLRDPSSPLIPTTQDVVHRLAPFGITADAVNAQVDYLAKSKLKVRSRDAGSPSGKGDWQRAAIVGVALRFNLVRDTHLALLPRGGAHGAPRY